MIAFIIGVIGIAILAVQPMLGFLIICLGIWVSSIVTTEFEWGAPLFFAALFGIAVTIF